MRERKITLLGPEGTNVSIFFLFLIFNVISWFTLFVLTEGIELNFNNILIRQIVFTLLSVGVFFLLTYISIENLQKYTDSFFIIILILLAALLRTTPKAGVRRWFDLGPIDFQPSEFAKVIVVLFIANFFIQRRSKYPLVLYLGLILMLILQQPDLGTSIIIGFVIFSMIFVSEIKIRNFVLIVLLVFLTFFLFLEAGLINENQLDRINSFFSTDEDFQQSQSRLLISSGSLFGQYFQLEKVSKIFVPVETTDFIFAAYAYNFGFIGVLLILFLWFVFFLRLTQILRVSNSDFDKFVITGFITLLAFQIIVNISTITGLLPLTGLPFPLLSLGGSSMVSTAVIFGITNRIFIENNLVI
jgi:cell division protein FtsW (lipid II flippase)